MKVGGDVDWHQVGVWRERLLLVFVEGSVWQLGEVRILGGRSGYRS